MAYAIQSYPSEGFKLGETTWFQNYQEMSHRPCSTIFSTPRPSTWRFATVMFIGVCSTFPWAIFDPRKPRECPVKMWKSWIEVSTDLIITQTWKIIGILPPKSCWMIMNQPQMVVVYGIMAFGLPHSSNLMQDILLVDFSNFRTENKIGMVTVQPSVGQLKGHRGTSSLPWPLFSQLALCTDIKHQHHQLTAESSWDWYLHSSRLPMDCVH